MVDVFRVKDVWVKGNNGFYILKDINLKIQENTVVALVGRNGAGKTTLMKTMLNILSPTKGQVLFRNTPVQQIKNIFNEVGLVLQNPDHQLFSFSSRDEIEFVLKNHNMNKNADEIIKKFNLEKIAERHPFWLSEGEKKKLCIVSILAYNPSVLFLDEPFSTLDWFERREMLKMIMKLRDEGKTILLTTHDLNLIKNVDKIVVMKNGKIVGEGDYEYMKEVLEID